MSTHTYVTYLPTLPEVYTVYLPLNTRVLTLQQYYYHIITTATIATKITITAAAAYELFELVPIRVCGGFDGGLCTVYIYV